MTKNEKFKKLILQVLDEDHLKPGCYVRFVRAFNENTGVRISKATVWNWLQSGVPPAKSFICEELSRKFAKSSSEVITAHDLVGR